MPPEATEVRPMWASQAPNARFTDNEDAPADPTLPENEEEEGELEEVIPLRPDVDTQPDQQRLRWAWKPRLSPLWAILPFFIAKPLGRTDRSLPQPTSTSYINGMRGLACIIVLNQHLFGPYHPEIFSSYIIDGDPGYARFWQLPYLRLFHCGLFMVALFFVLSGFVLTYSPLTKMKPRGQTENDAGLLKSLASSLFRRPLRLFMPMMAAVAINGLLLWCFPDTNGGGWRNSDPSVLQFAGNIMTTIWPVLNPFTWAYYWPKGFMHAWTLQQEYRGSVVVFLLCLMTCKLPRTFRLVVLTFSAFYSMYWLRWEVFCFIEGMLIAELRIRPIGMPDVSWFRRALPWTSSLPEVELPTYIVLGEGAEKQPTEQRGPICRLGAWVFWSLVMAFALLVGGWPVHYAAHGEPWASFYAVTPAWWTSHGESEPDLTQTYWISIGAGLLLLSAEALPLVQALFNTRLMVYLGEISYSFYLLHWPAMYTFAAPLIGKLHELGYSLEVCIAIGYICNLAVLLCVADLFWRGVDEKAVNAARRFSKWCGF